jgi:transposase
VYNNRQGFEKFWAKLCRFKTEHGLEDVMIGFESTGPYAEPICNFFRKKSVQVVQVNPMHTKRIKELTGNSPNKTDKKDPRVIADVITLGHSLTVVVPEGPAAQLRRLTHARERAISHRTAINNQLQHLVFVVFPELLTIINPSTKTGMYLMKNYPDPKNIVSIGIESLSGFLRKISRGRFNQDHAEKLFEAAQESVGITEGKESILLEIRHLVSSIENQNRFIECLENQIAEYLKQIPYSQSMMSIKGIGHITVAGLIGEVGDFKKFKTIPEIMKLAGLNLFEVSSGSHQGRHHISKRGRSLMRKLLFFAAINVVRSNGIMHEKYQRMLDNGTIKIKALVAISRKLLRIIFALARDNAEYDHEYNSNHDYKLAA